MGSTPSSGRIFLGGGAGVSLPPFRPPFALLLAAEGIHEPVEVVLQVLGVHPGESVEVALHPRGERIDQKHRL